jgi:hypothetical protein
VVRRATVATCRTASRPNKPANDDRDSDKVIANPRLRRLRVEVTLDVFGDGTRLIPSDKAGGASPLKMVIFDARKPGEGAPQSSTKFHS